MIAYRVLDEDLVLPICLHGGAVPLARLQELAAGTPFESQFGLALGVHSRLMWAVARAYGATGVVAVASDQIVGLLRFAPRALRETLGHLCPQDEPYARALAKADEAALPDADQLGPRALQIECLQIAEAYQSRGIGQGLVGQAIAWARAHGWEELWAEGIAAIYPLMAWAGQMSARALEKHGFEVMGQRIDEGLREGAASQIAGYHGQDVQDVWRDGHVGVTAEDAALRYEMRLLL